MQFLPASLFGIIALFSKGANCYPALGLMVVFIGLGIWQTVAESRDK